jgi:hypothetical protein
MLSSFLGAGVVEQAGLAPLYIRASGMPRGGARALAILGRRRRTECAPCCKAFAQLRYGA